MREGVVGAIIGAFDDVEEDKGSRRSGSFLWTTQFSCLLSFAALASAAGLSAAYARTTPDLAEASSRFFDGAGGHPSLLS